MVHFIDMWYTVYTLYQDYQEWWFSIAMFKYWRAFFCSKQHLWGLSLSDCQALTALLKAWWFWPKVPPLDFRLWTISLSKQILGVHWVHGFGGTNRRLWTSKIINDWDFPWSFSPKKKNFGMDWRKNWRIDPPRTLPSTISFHKRFSPKSIFRGVLAEMRAQSWTPGFRNSSSLASGHESNMETAGKSSIELDDFPRNCLFLGIS